MKTKKMITTGVLAMAVWLGLFFQPQPALAANGEAGAETEAGMPDTESRVSDDPQESIQAGENIGQKAGSGGMMPDGVATHFSRPIITLVACHRINRYNDMRTEKGKGSRTPIFSREP